jgi:hypothetical protein
VPVTLLFEHDGCKVFRFGDNGRNHYFVHCPASASVEAWHVESCGKNCQHSVPETVETR